MLKERIHIGEPELVRRDDQLPYTFDAIHVAFKNPDGTFNLLTTDLGEKPYYHKNKATAEDVFMELGTFEMDYNGYCDTWPSGLWLWSAHKCDDGMIFAFCHRELISRRDPFFLNSFLMGIAVSYDNGESWKYLGDILGNSVNGHPGEWGNMGGCPMFIKDGYIYLYFNDFQPNKDKVITAARMELDETIAAVRRGELPKTVKKYSGNGVWATDPISGTGANILPPLAFMPDTHGSGVYCKPLGAFIMLLQTGGVGKLEMFITRDAEHFEEHFSVDETGADDLMQPYSFFLPTDGDCSDDLNEIGGEFYIYYLHKGIKNYSYDELYRRKVTIE